MPAASMAIACCRATKDGPVDELYPDPDLAPLLDAASETGVAAVAVTWDHPDVAWSRFSHVLVSSTWDSVDRPGEYLDWVRSVSQQTNLANPADVLAWNLDKRYLRDLAAAGVPTVPTAWVEHDADGVGGAVEAGGAGVWPEAAEFVVKPSVSAGGRKTARYSSTATGMAEQHVRGLLAAGQAVLVQPYLNQAEHDLVFLGGTFSHAVLKRPLLRTGEGVVERLWERITFGGLVTPSEEQRAVAAAALGVLERRFDRVPPYARVDLIGDVVLEMELVDPYLSLDVGPGDAAAQLIRAVLAG